MTSGTRVIKIGGRPQSEPTLSARIAQLWNCGTNPLVIVHGGGDEVTALQTSFGLQPQFVGGRRVTQEKDIDVLRMALSGAANKRLVSALIDDGIKALGLSGEDAALITASPVDAERLGYVGAPHRANVELLWHLLDGGYLPVISPVSRNACAGSASTLGNAAALNVNGDDAASALAVALAAEELLLVADVPGVMSDGTVIAQLGSDLAHDLMATGTAAGGMRAKIEAALAALEGGVNRVRIGDLAAISDPDRGTLFVD